MNIAAYLRLSDDDNDISDIKLESNSISGQRSIINEFIAANPELCNSKVTEFCDDGHTGVNFNRPSVKRLFNAVKSGEIQCIIVKDLSRFGRNVVEVGNYVEQIFPLLGVRFISVNDSFDSKNVVGAADTGFALRNIMNENYSIDISSKVKSVKKIHKQKGYFLGGQAPYGYCVKDKHLYIDPKAAEIVREIFKMADMGFTYKIIARVLNDENIPTRTEYSGIKNRTHLWEAKHISAIVHNPVYVGTLINNKQETIAPRKTKANDKCDWLIFENHHEPIVTKELFNSVAKRFYDKKQSSTNTDYYPEFKGKVFCGGCGKLIDRHYITDKNNHKRTFYYMCNYSIANKCCNDKVLVDDLKAIVIKSLSVQLEIVTDKCNAVINDFKINSQQTDKDTQKLSNEITSLEKRKLVLYTDYKNGIYTKTEFVAKREQLLDKIKQLLDQKDSITNKLPKKAYAQATDFMDSYKNDKPTQEALIKKYLKAVYIHSTTRIEIVWNFDDIFK